MDIILKEDIVGLGYQNDVIQVKPGYGRNYLIPQGLAIIANSSNRKMVEENLKQAAHKAERVKEQAETLANAIGDLELVIETKAGESGKIFGAVTTLQISDSLKEKGFDIDRKRISFKTDVKMVGEYTAELNLHKEVKKEVAFKVVAI